MSAVPSDQALATLHLAAEAAGLLLSNGQTTERVGLAIQRLGALDGGPFHVSVRWDELTVSSPSCPAGVRLFASPSAIDIARVSAVEAVVNRVSEGRLGIAAARDQLAAVAATAPVPLLRFAPMAAAGAAGLGIIFGAADALTLTLIAASAGFGGVVRRGLSHVSANPFLQPLAAALLAGLMAGAASGLPVSHRLLAVCPCMVLVPGPHFLNGTIDLVRARLPLGMARLTFAGLVIGAICLGLLFGLRLGGAGLGASSTTSVVPFAYDVCAAGLAVAAYGSFFNMPWRMLPLPIGVGMAAHALRWMLLASGVAVPTGALAACLVVSSIISPMAHRLRVPWGALAFASVVSMMPGVFFFQAASDATVLVVAPLSSVPAGLPLDLARNKATASLILIAMTCGLLVPKLITDQLLAGSLRRASRSRLPHKIT